MLSFGEKIKSARKAHGLTQKQLAEKIGAAHNSISDWENNKNKPDPDMIELLCGVLGVTPNYLLASSPDDFSPEEKLLIKKYRSLDSTGKKCIDFIINIEIERTVNLEEMREAQKKRILTYEKALKEMHGNKSPHAYLDILSESVITYGTNAAHERTDINVTDEMRKHDDKIMNDDSEWE